MYGRDSTKSNFIKAIKILKLLSISNEQNRNSCIIQRIRNFQSVTKVFIIFSIKLFKSKAKFGFCSISSDLVKIFNFMENIEATLSPFSEEISKLVSYFGIEAKIFSLPTNTNCFFLSYAFFFQSWLTILQYCTTHRNFLC